MTEIIKNTEAIDIHWTGFATSLIGAPVLLSACIMAPLQVLNLVYDSRDIDGLMSVMMILIAIGATLYFVIGTPVLIWHLRRHAPQTGRIVMLSLSSLLWLIPLGGLLALLTFDPGAIYFASISIGFGLFGAPPLALIFTLLYKRFVPA